MSEPPARSPVDEARDRSFWEGTWDDALRGGLAAPEEPTWTNIMERRRLDFLDPYLPERGRVLDVGCGSARLSARIGRLRPLRMTGVDYSLAGLRTAGRTADSFGVAVQRVGGDARALPVADASCDLVISGGLLEHFPDPEPVLREMVRVLRPGGALYAGVVPRRLVSLHRPRHVWRGRGVYRSRFGPRDYAGWLRDLGCTDVRGLWCGVYPPLMHMLPARWRLGVERRMRRLDGTWLAGRLGYYMLLGARVPGAAPA